MPFNTKQIEEKACLSGEASLQVIFGLEFMVMRSESNIISLIQKINFFFFSIQLAETPHK